MCLNVIAYEQQWIIESENICSWIKSSRPNKMINLEWYLNVDFLSYMFLKPKKVCSDLNRLKVETCICKVLLGL